MCLKTVILFAYILTEVSGFSLTDFGQPSRRLDGAEVAMETVKNLLQCRALCGRRTSCLSVNYDTKTRRCTANSKDSKTAPSLLGSSVPEVIYAEKRSMSKSDDVCGSLSCKPSQICAETNSHPVCLTEENVCGAPSDIAHATKNKTKRSGVSVTIYKCKDGYAVISGNTTSVCDVSRKWTPTNLTCSVDCGTLPVRNGTFQHEGTTEGRVGHVVCKNYFRFFGSSAEATCQSNRTWAGLDGECKRVEWRKKKTHFLESIPGPPTDGWEMIFVGTPTANCKRFTVNLKNGKQIHLHFDIRFENQGDSHTIIVNVKFGKWGEPITKKKQSLFASLVQFELRIKLVGNTYEITIDGRKFVDFTAERPPEQIVSIGILLDVTIQKVKLVYPKQLFV